MSRINPLHIIGLLVVVLLFFMMKLGGAKDELEHAKESYKETLKIATQLNGLKGVYADNKRVKKSLNRLLRQPSLTQANIQKKFTATGVILSSDGMGKKALNSLMGKLLNGSYNIYSFKIKRLTKDSASLKMEIKW